MNDDDYWVELFWLQWPKDESLDHRALEVQLAIRGYDMKRNTNPNDVRVDTVRASGPKALRRVSIRRVIVEGRTGVVTQTPVERLRVPGSTDDLDRLSDVGSEEIKELLRARSLTFAFVDVGQPIGWVDPSRTFDVWKVEAQCHLIEPGARIDREALADGYGYLASQWSNKNLDHAVVVLEQVH